MTPPGHGLAFVATEHFARRSGFALSTRAIIFSVSPPAYAKAVSSSWWPASRKVAIKSRVTSSSHSVDANFHPPMVMHPRMD
jgi:hypothetical protein